MGALYQEPPLLQDLNLTITTSSTLFPSEPTERRSMFLSNIDQVLNFSVVTVHFFTAQPKFPPELVVERLRYAVERVLVPYDFLAGRLRIDVEGGRLEIDCNAAGVGFVAASSEFKLEEIGELDYPNQAFRQLAVAGLPQPEGLNLEDQPLISFQLTSFKCGGFALGISNNHATFDGISFSSFLRNLAAVAAGEPLAVHPFSNRRLLSARSPPLVSFPHPELVDAASASPTMLEPSSSDLHLRLFHLSAADIASLKLRALPLSSKPTSFNTVVAHLWRCKALAGAGGVAGGERVSTVLYAVDIRRRLRPPLPAEFTGNAVLSGYGMATVRELEEGPFGRVVEAVATGAARMDDEYVRSVIDWGSVHRGFPSGDVFVSSWWRLGFAGVKFPWGSPAYSCPVAHPRRDIVLLLPTVAGEDEGVNALVVLPPGDMESFAVLFKKFLAE
ncbi:Omega-hydroxypalmitate O-feruloyl transferase [Apostasia shenzhenica]|uniref:Omega-hydroxypalmitate O-feruloyl transferase n=1 Tax=Apostasia shenzhenica TaxID=1088818 RepID=A0A2I0AGZ2_9ASPA|nr:Omega-hydroxypalmitate O-feruloyl transferase [Apostasia shenzhenica]